MPFSLTYPASLTVKDWNKKKGLIAKIVTKETGIGAGLKACEEAFKDLEKSVNAALKGIDPLGQFDQLGSKYDLTSKRLKATAKLCADQAKQWKPKTCPVPKSVRVHTEDMASQAAKLDAELKLDYDKCKLEAKKNAAEIAAQIQAIWKNAIPAVATAIEQVLASPDSGTFDSKFLQKARTLAAGLGRDPSMKKEVATWTTIANSNYIQGEDADGIKKKMKDVKKALAKLQKS